MTGGTAARRARVLVVDDEPRMGKALERLLAPDHEVAPVDELRATWGLTRNGPAVL